MSAIVQVDWWAMDKSDPSPQFPDGYPYYRTCDMCGYQATADIWAGQMDEAQWRQFHRVCGGPDDGLTVCENCLPDFLRNP